MKRICYKVTDFADQSCYANSKERVKYILGRWVYPNIQHSKLFVFDTLEDAQNYKYSFYQIIWECEVLNPKKIKRVVLNAFSNSDVKKYWKNYHQKKTTYIGANVVYRPPIPGTIICDGVKLIKRIA